MSNCSSSFFNHWSQIPYPNQSQPYHGIDVNAGSWPLRYLNRSSSGTFTKQDNSPISMSIVHPSTIDFNKELEEVIDISNHLTPSQIALAKYYGNGVPVVHITPIVVTLIRTYKLSPAYSARVMSTIEQALNDAFIITWHYKYLWDYPRPVQLNPCLSTVIPTPQFPTYPSGHSVISGAAEMILSYYFPAEKDKFHMLAESASISRLYAGVHFRSDLTEGLRLGRQLGSLFVEFLQSECDQQQSMIDHPYTNYLNAPIIPTIE